MQKFGIGKSPPKNLDFLFLKSPRLLFSTVLLVIKKKNQIRGGFVCTGGEARFFWGGGEKKTFPRVGAISFFFLKGLLISALVKKKKGFQRNWGKGPFSIEGNFIKNGGFFVSPPKPHPAKKTHVVGHIFLLVFPFFFFLSKKIDLGRVLGPQVCWGPPGGKSFGEKLKRG